MLEKKIDPWGDECLVVQLNGTPVGEVIKKQVQQEKNYNHVGVSKDGEILWLGKGLRYQSWLID